jgi:hypothetical protein
MKTSKKSFTSKIVAWGKDAWDRENNMPKDFCSYWRMFMWKLFLMSSLAGLAGMYLGFLTAGIVSWIVAGVLVSGVVKATLTTLAMASFFVAVYFIINGIEKLVKNQTVSTKIKRYICDTSPVQLVKTKYQSWKDKYCPSMDYTD